MKKWLETLRALRVLWGAAALLLLLDLALQPDNPPKSSLAAMTAHASEPAPAEVLLIGSSRLRVVDAGLVAEAAGRPHAVNVAFNAGGGQAMDLLSARFLTPEVLEAGGTRLMIIGIGAMDLNDGVKNPIITKGWGWGDMLTHVLHHGTDDLTRGFLFDRALVRHSALLSSVRHGKLRGRVRAVGLRLMGQLGLVHVEAPERAPKAPPEGGDDVLNNASARSAKGAQSIEGVAPPTSSIYLRDLHMGGRQRDHLIGMIERLRGSGVHVALVHLPVSDWYAHVYTPEVRARYRATSRALAEEADAPLFWLEKASWGLVDDDYFKADGRFDGHHIASEGGRARFSRALGARVAGPLLARLDRGEPVGFAQSILEEILP